MIKKAIVCAGDKDCQRASRSVGDCQKTVDVLVMLDIAKRQNVGVGWYLQRELQSIEDRKMEEILIPTRSACTCLLLAFSVTASAVR
jgi:hypothetical protein